MDALVEVHAVDWRACGLEGYGKPTGYLDRQLRRFGGLWEHNRTRELPVLDRVTAWLAEHKPDSGEATIVHGDYRLGNTMFAPGAPARLAAIFDWELATIGDPLADVGYLVATWAQPGDAEDTLFGLSAVTRRPGFPTRERADLALRGALRPLDVRPALVHDAGAVEVGGVPGGLLQAAAGRHHRGRVLRPARGRRAGDRRAGMGDRSGPDRRLRRRPDDRRVRLLPRVLRRGRAAGRTRCASASGATPRHAACWRSSRPASSRSRSSSRASPALLERRVRAADRPAVRAAWSPTRRCSTACAPRARAGVPHRPAVELLGRRDAYDRGAAGGAVRRR